MLVLAQTTWAQNSPDAVPATPPPVTPAAATPPPNTPAVWHLFKQSNSHIDLKFIDPAKGTFGIDYRAELSRASPYATTAATADSKNALYHSTSFGLDSKGFIVVGGPTQTTNQVNSIINELHADAAVFFAKPATTVKHSRADATPEEAAALAGSLGPTISFFGNVHAKHETSQNFADYDFALGPTLAVRTSLLSYVLDVPFAIFRTQEGNNPRQLDLSAALDYVAGLKNTQSTALREKSSTARFNVRAEWETGIFASDRVVFYNDFYYEIAASDRIDAAGLTKKNFFMARFDHFLDAKRKKTISIKYTKGALPPNFTEGYVLGAGFSVDF